MNCPICNGDSVHFMTRKFAPQARTFVENENFSVEYKKCEHCGLVFCEEMIEWMPQKYSELVYNDGYIPYDRDVVTPNGSRQTKSLEFIKQFIQDCHTNLDYGGGRGYLSDMLNNNGYKSVCYDPFTENNNKELLNAKYDFVSCIEVLEHAYNIMDVVKTTTSIAKKYIYVSTALYDNVQDWENWYYFNPRVGHILLFNRKSLELLFDKFGFEIVLITQMHKEQMNILLRRKSNASNNKLV